MGARSPATLSYRTRALQVVNASSEEMEVYARMPMRALSRKRQIRKAGKKVLIRKEDDGGTDLEPSGSRSRAVHKEPGKQGDSPQKGEPPVNRHPPVVRPNKLRPAPHLRHSRIRSSLSPRWPASQRLPHHGWEPLPSEGAVMGTHQECDSGVCLSGAEVGRENTFVADCCYPVLTNTTSVEREKPCRS